VPTDAGKVALDMAVEIARTNATAGGVAMVARAGVIYLTIGIALVAAVRMASTEQWANTKKSLRSYFDALFRDADQVKQMRDTAGRVVVAIEAGIREAQAKQSKIVRPPAGWRPPGGGA